MKKYIISILIVGVFSITVGYLGGFILNQDRTTEVKQTDIIATQEKQINIKEETISIENLSKTYLVASSNFDWDTILKITTGKYKDELQNTIIPNMTNTPKENLLKYSFNPRSLDIQVESITNKEAIANVDYIMLRTNGTDTVQSQERIKLYLIKDKNIWKIFSVETL